MGTGDGGVVAATAQAPGISPPVVLPAHGKRRSRGGRKMGTETKEAETTRRAQQRMDRRLSCAEICYRGARAPNGLPLWVSVWWMGVNTRGKKADGEINRRASSRERAADQ